MYTLYALTVCHKRSDCLTADGEGFAEGNSQIPNEFDTNTNEKPSSTRNIPKLTGTAQLAAGWYKSASKTLIRQASNNIAIWLIGLLDVRLKNMAATSTSSGCIHSSIQSRPVRCGVHSVCYRARHTSRSSAACGGMTRPNINQFLQGWHGKSFCKCCFAKLALAITVKSQQYMHCKEGLQTCNSSCFLLLQVKL